MVINDAERKNLTRDIQNEMLGFGPLEALLADPTVSDILVNDHKQVYVERRGKLELTDVAFNDDAHLMKIIDKIVSRVGRRIDESSPMVDARLPDGSRVNAIIPPLAIDGPVMSIRRFSADPLRLADLVAYGSMTAEMAEVLQGLGKAKMNILISGGTGSGKTTMLNVISGFIGHNERIVTVEDAAELQLQQPHVVRLETRPPNIEGKGEVTQRALVRNALRMRPDRIILGEVRGAEALDMLGAMNTGHEGSMATIHANTPRDAITRLENMISMAAANLPSKAMRQQISSAVGVVVQVSRLTDGKRKVRRSRKSRAWKAMSSRCRKSSASGRPAWPMAAACSGISRATGMRPQFPSACAASASALPAAHLRADAAAGADAAWTTFLLVYLLVFLAPSCCWYGGVYVGLAAARGPGAERVARRLRAMNTASDDAQKPRVDRQGAAAQRAMPGSQRLLRRLPGVRRLDRLLLQAGRQLECGRACSADACWLCWSALLLGALLHLPGICACCWRWPVRGAAVLCLIARAKASRLARIEQQLPEALDMMSRAMRAGHAFPTALKMVADEMTAPLGEEFRAVFDEVNFGVSMGDAPGQPGAARAQHGLAVFRRGRADPARNAAAT